MYTIKVRKDLKNLENHLEFEESTAEKTFQIEINETEDAVEIITHGEIDSSIEPGLITELELVFNYIKFEKSSSNILNIKEISKKWETIKKDSVFKRQDTDTISLLMHLAKFYENEESLTNIIKNHSFIPFLLFFYKNREIDGVEELFKISNIFSRDEVDFKLKLNKGKEDNEYILSSEIDSRFRGINFHNDLKKKLGLLPQHLFNPNVFISGNYIYSDKLETMKIEMLITSREDMRYTKTIEISQGELDG